MRVAIVAEVYLPKIDGVVHRTRNLIRELTSAGDEVLVVCPEADGCRSGPVPVVPCRSFAFPLYPEYRVGLPGPGLADAVRRFEPDVIHYVNPFAFGFRCYDRLFKERVTAPTVFSFHTLYGEFVKGYRSLASLSQLLWWLTREYHNRADVNLTVSGIMRDDLEERGFRRVRLWPPAVDGRLFHPSRQSAAMRERLGGRPGQPLLLTVSRLAPEKNVEFLASLLAELPGARLAVVGDGPHRRELERKFAGLDAHFVGYLTGEALATAYASADLFVYASETETMGNVVLEAMAAGCAVVAPRAGGIPDLVADGKSGFLFEPGDARDALRLTRLALAEGRSDALGAAARRRVEGWDWAHAVGKVRDCYREAINTNRRGVLPPTGHQRLAQAAMATLVSAFRSTSTLQNARPRTLLRKTLTALESSDVHPTTRAGNRRGSGPIPTVLG